MTQGLDRGSEMQELLLLTPLGEEASCSRGLPAEVIDGQIYRTAVLVRHQDLLSAPQRQD